MRHPGPFRLRGDARHRRRAGPGLPGAGAGGHGADRRTDAAHGRAHPAAPPAQPLPGPAGAGNDRLRDGGAGGGGDEARRGGLSRQALRGQRSAAEGGAFSAPACKRAVQDDRRGPAHPRTDGTGPPGGGQRCHGHDRRRVRGGQGGAGALHSRTFHACRRALHRDQLRRHTGEYARGRVVRLREGCLYRRAAFQCGQVRTGPGRHPAAGRDIRDEPVAAGQAVAGAAGARGGAHRRARADPARRARAGHQQPPVA